MQIILYGSSSKKEIILNVLEKDLDKTMLEWLRDNNIPVASSCRGLGICEKCLINTRHLSCEYTVKSFLEKIGNRVEISYL